MVTKLTKLGALAQLVARDIRIVEVRGSTPLCSTEALQINVCKVFLYSKSPKISMQILRIFWLFNQLVLLPILHSLL